jgi:protein ImuB
VHFPWLPAERLIRARAAPPDAPFALIEKQKGAMRLSAVSQAAHLLGLTSGLTLADARARVPDLPAYDSDQGADLALLGQLADACLRYTPRVMVEPPQGLILDISGCAHLFDSNLSRGEKMLANDLADRLRDAGLTARCAFSPSVDAALALAIFGLEEGQVQRLPVAALRCDASVQHMLRRAGLTQIRDLAARPRTILASRFGEGVTHSLARLLGEVDTPIIPRRQREPIICEARFAEPVAHSDSVRRIMAELATEAISQLAECGEGARAVIIQLFRCDGQIARLEIQTAAPTRDAALLLRLFDERIDALSDPLDPGFGYDSVTLSIPSAEPLGAVQQGMDARAVANREALAALLARLSTRLGPERVTRWRHIDSHVPEEVFVDGAVILNTSPERGGGSPQARRKGSTYQHSDYQEVGPLGQSCGLPPPRSGEEYRPLLLLHPPQPIEAIAEVPDGPPYRFRWKGQQHRVARHEGPERIAMPWWQGRHAEARLTRDYYRVEDVEGRRFWLFRHGLYSEKADPGWYLHGLFA